MTKQERKTISAVLFLMRGRRVSCVKVEAWENNRIKSIQLLRTVKSNKPRLNLEEQKMRQVEL